MKVIDLDDFETDTKDWGDYCLGYHSIRVPPGLVPSVEIATNIDWHYPKIARNYAGSALSWIENQGRFGGVVFKTRVNGWDYVVAKERRSAIRVSKTELVLYGARKFGDDVILFHKDASMSHVGDGSDPKYRQFYENLDAKPETPRHRNKGFCFDGYVFTGYKPQHGYNFWASFKSPLRHGYRLHLSQEMKSPPKDDRPLAPQANVKNIPFIRVDEYGLKKNGHAGALTMISGTEGDAHRHSLKAIVIGPYGDINNPIISYDTIKDIGPMNFDAGINEGLALLSNIRANQGI